MELERKLAILADAAKYDASCASSGSRRGNGGEGLGDTDGVGICHSYTPDGRCISLLKILLTNYCIYDCRFCVNRVSSDVARARFTVDEVVWLTTEFYKRNYIEGLFLSSGIVRSPDYTMERLVAIARTLRERERFFGYVHLKAIPGADPALLELAGRYADRLSANVELPTEEDLQRLAPEKSLRVVNDTMRTIHDHVAESREASGRAQPKFAPAGQTTQVVVGATPTPDAKILTMASGLYERRKLRRVYYSAFSPIPAADRELPSITPPLVREHRLYQADWLMRFYGFRADELTEPDAPSLPLDVDPKLAWALRNRAFFPIDVNAAPREALLRVPGLGVRNVDRILRMRRLRRVRLADLRRIRVALKRARPFVIAADWRPTDEPESATLRPTLRQRSLFEAERQARTGQL